MNFFNHEISLIKRKGLYRRLKILQGEQGPHVHIDGRDVILLSSNNYLGLTSHTSVKKASIDAINRYGCGSGASRLISGNSELYSKLEKKIAHFKQVEDAVIFSSGYMANIGIISAVCGKGDIILCDKLNHASIIDGCRMSRAEFKRYPHKDISALEDILKKSSSLYKKKIIVTDGIFSMDGDIAPVPDIIKIAERFSALVIVDEAHAIGVLGKYGRGITEYFDIEDNNSIISMGTFGKAFGSFGAYVAGNKEVIDFLINRSRNFIFTTALPPSVLAASIAAIEIVENNPDLMTNLFKNADYMRAGLIASGFNTLDSNTHIIPVVVGDPHITVKIAEKLFECGIFIQGIRPPSVARGTSRLRVTVMSNHTVSDLDFALDAFRRIGKEF